MLLWCGFAELVWCFSPYVCRRAPLDAMRVWRVVSYMYALRCVCGRVCACVRMRVYTYARATRGTLLNRYFQGGYVCMY